jgi:hypothetical protein
MTMLVCGAELTQKEQVPVRRISGPPGKRTLMTKRPADIDRTQIMGMFWRGNFPPDSNPDLTRTSAGHPHCRFVPHALLRSL